MRPAVESEQAATRGDATAAGGTMSVLLVQGTARHLPLRDGSVHDE